MYRPLFTGKPYNWFPGLIILLTGVTLALAVIVLHEIEGQLVGSAGKTLALAAAEIADKVDWFLDERARHIQAVAMSPLLRETDRAVIGNYLAGLRAAYPDYVWLGLIDAEGLIVAATDPSTVGLDRSRSRGFREARDTGRIIWEDVEPVQGAVGMDAVGWTVPIIGPRGESLGAISTRVGLPGLEDIQTKTIKTFQARHGFLASVEYQFMTNDGDAFVDSDLQHKGHVNLKRLALPSVLLSESGDPGFVEEEHLLRHVPVITGYAKTAERQGFKGSRWTILIRADRADVVAPIRTTLWKLGATGALIYLPLLAVLLWTGRNVRREWVKAQLERVRATVAESKYRLLLESTGEGLYGIDREGRCIFINKAAAAMLGYAPAVFLGKGMHQIHHHSRPNGSPYPVEDCLIHRAFRNGNGCRGDNEVFWRKDGTRFPVEYSSRPILDAGAVTGAVVAFTDIAERKQSETALIQSERRIRTILENALDAVIEMDEAGLVTEWSPRAQALFGWDRSEVIGKPLVDTIIPLQYLSAHTRGLQRFLADNEGVFLNRRIEITALRRDGTEFPIEIAISPLKTSTSYTFSAFITDITGRKRAEEALREANERLQTIIHASPLSILAIDAAGCIMSWNAGAERMFGWSEQEALGRVCPTVPPEGLEDFHGMIARVMQGETIAGLMRYRQRRDGALIHASLASAPLRNAAGKATGVVVILEDISERKQAEEKLLLSREIIANAHDPISIMDLQGRFTYQNSAHASLVGFSNDELLGKTPALFLGDEAFSSICRELAMAQRYCGELKARTKDGVSKNLELSVFTIRDAADKPTCYVAIKRDITERKQAEESLRESEAKFRAVLRATKDVIWEWDLKTNALWWSDNFFELFGYRPDEIEPSVESWSDRLHPDEKNRIVSDVYAAVQNNEPFWSGEYRFRRADGSYAYVYDRGYIKFDESGHPMLMTGALMDLTERKQVENELRRSEERLRQVLDEREQLSRDLHDNIIQSIYAVGLELEECQLLIEKKPAMAAETVSHAIAALNLVIRDVRNYIQEGGSGDVTGQQLRTQLAETAWSLNATHDCDFRISLQESTLAQLTPTEARHILSITREAMSNTLRHSKASRGLVFLKEHADCLRLVVRDDGVGFDAQAAPARGLGLRNIAARAAKLGARLEIVSESGQGTRILVEIPKEGHRENAMPNGEDGDG